MNNETNIEGVIFDLNGTLLLDSYLHEIAWVEMAKELRKKPLTVEEFQQNCHGITNKAIIEYLLGYEPEVTILEDIIERKEGMYRQMCLKNMNKFVLAPGAIDMLNQVKSLGLKITIATGSYIKNVDFYYKYLNLDNWFNKEDIVYDDGLFPGKPQPFPYIRAVEKLNLKPEQCIVFEDSYSGITSAIAAGIGRVVTVESQLDKTRVDIIGDVYKMANGFSGLNLMDLIK